MASDSNADVRQGRRPLHGSLHFHGGLRPIGCRREGAESSVAGRLDDGAAMTDRDARQNLQGLDDGGVSPSVAKCRVQPGAVAHVDK